MEIQATKTQLKLSPCNNTRLANLCGNLDEHIHHIEKRLHVEISNRGDIFYISGEDEKISQAKKVLEYLYTQTKNNKNLKPEQVHLAVQQIKADQYQTDEGKTGTSSKLPHNIATPNGMITLRNLNQKEYIHNIFNREINFGIGPAGTGKTYLAVAAAVAALEQQRELLENKEKRLKEKADYQFRCANSIYQLSYFYSQI
ncbi:PhoH family protein [uncultured Paraglaciecola sp.]|uniref:PhoH family protein n=1 Tax=uncultured Paraglaciecola sp. TaxID=1765024 RepID=UPI00262EB86A|nr:PhoH family protein [uncultured Paraglaciecola sp.]